MPDGGGTAQGLDLTSFYPDFGAIGSVPYFTVSAFYRTNCSSSWQPILPSYSVSPIGYKNCDVINGKTTSDQTGGLKGLNSSTDVALTAYPNPTTGLVEVNNEGEKIEAINVYNVTGALVSQKLNVANTNATLNLSSLAKGMYMINVQTATTNKTIQVVKE